jgi:beta-1,4-mannooligosaccharide/beta-1,4-mannosyl-N-acetylglucosamine phosphorylase
MSTSKKTILGGVLPNIPWEERPRNCRNVVWRYSRNPVIPRDLIPRANSIFNSRVVSFGKSFAGVFRVDDATRTTRIHNDYVSSP